MRAKSAGFLIAMFLVLAGNSLAKTPKAKAPQISWQDGQVISAALNGHGSNSNTRGVRASGHQEIWWSYCISNADQSYSVVSRLSPAKAGLLIDNPIKVSEKRNQLLILNSAGKQMELRILRKSLSAKCPQ
jgi:hypothetical protein